jgi:hypothetical protein
VARPSEQETGSLHAEGGGQSSSGQGKGRGSVTEATRCSVGRDARRRISPALVGRRDGGRWRGRQEREEAVWRSRERWRGGAGHEVEDGGGTGHEVEDGGGAGHEREEVGRGVSVGHFLNSLSNSHLDVF